MDTRPARVVVGVDPGGTTGIAVVEHTPEQGYRLLDHLGYPSTPAGVAAATEALIEEHAPVGLAGSWALAVERFVVGRRASRSSSAQAGALARDILGALEAAYPGQIYRATASEAKTWASDRRLKAAGLQPTQGLPHTRDAARHALFTLHKRYGCPDPLSASYRPGETDD